MKKKINPLVFILIAALLLSVITLVIVRFGCGYNYTVLSNGAKYIGEYESGQPTKGKINYPDGISGEIDYINRRITYSNGDLYEGDIKDGLRDGKGILYRAATGDKYECEFKQDEITGEGTITYQNQDVYTGSLLNAKKHGHGVFTYANGNKYEGDFADDVRSGKGVFTWASGTYYEGDFANDLKNGYGKMVFANGDVYEGFFKNDMRDGKGDYFWADGEKYNGTFRNNLMDTRLVDDNGEFIVNEKNEYVHGEEALYTFNTSRTYRGYFIEGKAVGVNVEG